MICFHVEKGSSKCVFVVQVVGMGSSMSLKTTVEQIFSTSIPESNECRSDQKTEFPVTGCQIIGSVQDSNVSWTVTEPLADISHCSAFIGETKIPSLLIIPLEFFQVIGTDSGLNLSTTLRNLRIDPNPQQLPLQVIITDEAESGIVEEADVLRKLDVLLKRTLSCSYELLYWRSSRQQASQCSVVDAMKAIAIKLVGSPSMSNNFLALEECIVSQRIQGVHFLSPASLRILMRQNADDESQVDGVLELERKGLVVIGNSRNQTENARSLQFLILQPMWFYDRVNSLIQAFLDRRTREDVTLLPSARNKTYCCSREILHSLVDQVLQDGSSKLAFMKALEYHSVIIMETDEKNTVLDGGKVFIPATIQNGSLPPLVGRVVTPLALKSPGKRRTRIPLSLYYRLVSALAKHFPSAVLCKIEARFNVYRSHVLQLLFSEEYSCIKVTMVVSTEDPTFTSTSTAIICSSAKQIIAQIIATLDRDYQTLNIQFAAVIEADPEDQMPVDFVDLGQASQIPDDQLYSVGNYPFYPANDFYLWFGKPGKMTRIREQFEQLSEHLKETVDVRKAAAFLFQTWRLEQIEVIDLLRTDEAARASVFLLLLDKRGLQGDILLKDILDDPTLRKMQDRKSHLPLLKPSISEDDRPTPSPRQHKHSGGSLVLGGDVEVDSAELPRPTASNTPTIGVRDNKPVAITDVSHVSKVHVPDSDSPHTAKDEPDGMISENDREPLTKHKDSPGQHFHRDVVVPSTTSLTDTERSRIAVPKQHTSTASEEPQVPKLFCCL
jgi:hypothetical protein